MAASIKKGTSDAAHHGDNDVEMKAFVHGFLNNAGASIKDFRWQSIPADGSTRRFWRISIPTSETTYIAMENAPTTPFQKRENLAYLEIGKHLFKKGMPIPEIYRVDLITGRFIMEDMGDTSLQECVAQLKERAPLYQKIIEILIHLQMEGADGFNRAWTCQTERYDRSVMRRYESDYFREAFLSTYLGLERDLSVLDGPFDHLAGMASKAGNLFFLHRDFQSRNIILSNDKIGILDWQGGRLGPLGYDLASLLIDPYTGLSIEEKDQVFQHYLDLLQSYERIEIGPFQEFFPYLAIQRNLQILGAFSYLTKVKKKTHFEAYISPALKSLHDLLSNLKDPHLSTLADLVKSILDK
jgi:aminoglycoside/choline kinase family phosphotransferase